MSALTSNEVKRLAKIESLIKEGINAVGTGLLAIQESQLYRLSYESFEDYCKDKWGFSRGRAYQLIDAEKVKLRLSKTVSEVPTKETHLREISKIPEKAQAKVVAGVMEQCEAENRSPTAKDFKQAAKSFNEPPDEQDSEDEYEDIEDSASDSGWSLNIARVDAIRSSVNSLMKQIRDAPDESGFEMVRELRNRISVDLSNVKSAVVGCVPYKTCPYCMGADTECSGCSGRGWVNKPDFNNAPKEMQDEIERLSSGGSQ